MLCNWDKIVNILCHVDNLLNLIGEDVLRAEVLVNGEGVNENSMGA